MKATIFGIAAAALAGMALATPASALPFAGGLQPADTIQKSHYVERRVVRRGPRCETIVKRHIGRFGRKVVTKTRRCF